MRCAWACLNLLVSVSFRWWWGVRRECRTSDMPGAWVFSAVQWFITFLIVSFCYFFQNWIDKSDIDRLPWAVSDDKDLLICHPKVGNPRSVRVWILTTYSRTYTGKVMRDGSFFLFFFSFHPPFLFLFFLYLLFIFLPLLLLSII